MKIHFFSYFLIACCIGALSRAAEWHYPHEGDSFPKWGGLCDNGQRQSPIDLKADESKIARQEPLKLHNYNKPQWNLVMVNNGHTIQLSGFDDDLTLTGGVLPSDYILEQLHIHWESEHTVDGTRYPLEVHFVHRNTIHPNVKAALNYTDGIAVVGVLFHLSSASNDELRTIINGLKKVSSYDEINKPVRVKDLKILDYLVPSMQNYFTYHGSLTTPSCAESVIWIVLKETYPVSAKQVIRFKQIEYKEGKTLGNNYRELQSKGRREVLLVSSASRLARLTPIIVILTFVLLAENISFSFPLSSKCNRLCIRNTKVTALL